MAPGLRCYIPVSGISVLSYLPLPYGMYEFIVQLSLGIFGGWFYDPCGYQSLKMPSVPYIIYVHSPTYFKSLLDYSYFVQANSRFPFRNFFSKYF